MTDRLPSPQLDDESAFIAEPRTVTRAYHFPPATPPPPADRCTRAQLCEIAADGVRDPSELLCSPAHVRAICRLIEEMRVEMRAADAQRAQAMSRLSDERRSSRDMLRQSVAELSYSALLHRQLCDRDRENDALRRALIDTQWLLHAVCMLQVSRAHASVVAGFERLSVTVSSQDYASGDDELARQIASHPIFDVK